MENLTKEMNQKLLIKDEDLSEEEYVEDLNFEGEDQESRSDEEKAAGTYHQYLRNKGTEDNKKRELKQWGTEEDDTLKALYAKYGPKWKDVAKELVGRTPTQCSQRWRRLNPVKTRNPWTEEEDQQLKDLVSQYGFRWQLIATYLTERNGKQARERFINHLDPCINHEAWTDEEDLKLLDGFNQFGGKWSLISKLLPGRPENMIKNRFYSFIKKVYPSKLNKVYLTKFESTIEDINTDSYVNDTETLPDMQFDQTDSQLKEEHKSSEMEREVQEGASQNLKFYPNLNEFNYDEFEKDTQYDNVSKSSKNLMKMEYIVSEGLTEQKVCTLTFDEKKKNSFINPEEFLDFGEMKRENSFGDELIFKKNDLKISYESSNVETDDLYKIRDAVHTFKRCVDEEIDNRNSNVTN